MSLKSDSAFKVPHCANFYSGDPYIRSQEEKVKELNKKVKQLEDEVRRLRKQLDDRCEESFQIEIITINFLGTEGTTAGGQTLVPRTADQELLQKRKAGMCPKSFKRK